MAGGAGVILGLALAVAMALAVVALLLRRRVRALEAQAAHAEAAAATHRGAEAAERARAEFYREILDTLPIPIWRRAQDLTLLFVNRAYAFAAGADSPAEALIAGKEIGADDAASLARRARNTGEALSESRATIVGEDRVLIEATERPLPTGGLVGDGRDVTALIAAQDEQARLIEAHAEVLERVGSAVAVFTSARHTAFFNAAFTELFDFESEVLIDMTLTEMLEDLRARRMLPEVVDFQAFKSARMADFQHLLDVREQYLYLPDGRTLKESIAPHPQGGLIYIYDDVSDRLALERSYKMLDRVQRQTLDALQEGIAVFGEDGRLRLSNPAFDAVFLAEGETGREPHVSHVADAARTVLTQKSWRDGRDDLVESVTNRKSTVIPVDTRDGRLLEIATAPLADGGVLLAVYDITDRLAIEQGLRAQAEALRAVDRLKSEFLAGISYELRTPLTSILGFADMLRAGAAGPISPRQADYLDDILSAANAFIAMVDDIIDVAAIEAGRTSLERASTPAAEAIGVAASAAAARIAPLPLNIAPSAESGLIFDADLDRLRQILTRLITVAGQYARDAATVTVTAKSDGDWAVVTVTVGDSALPLGLSAGLEPARTAGASIDLNLATRLAQAHGGDLTVERAGPGMLLARCRLPRGRPTL